MSGKLKYIKGDATKPLGRRKRAIIHCCNDIGGWGSGFVVAVSKRDSAPEVCYRNWATQKEAFIDNNTDLAVHPEDSNCHIFHKVPFVLGQIQPVRYQNDDNLCVINMIGQRSIGMSMIKVGGDIVDIPPVRYEALSECLYRVAGFCLAHGWSVHCPRFGAGLAGGDWGKIEQLIIDNVCANGVPVTVYDF